MAKQKRQQTDMQQFELDYIIITCSKLIPPVINLTYVS